MPAEILALLDYKLRVTKSFELKSCGRSLNVDVMSKYCCFMSVQVVSL